MENKQTYNLGSKTRTIDREPIIITYDDCKELKEYQDVPLKLSQEVITYKREVKFIEDKSQSVSILSQGENIAFVTGKRIYPCITKVSDGKTGLFEEQFFIILRIFRNSTVFVHSSIFSLKIIDYLDELGYEYYQEQDLEFQESQGEYFVQNLSKFCMTIKEQGSKNLSIGGSYKNFYNKSEKQWKISKAQDSDSNDSDLLVYNSEEINEMVGEWFCDFQEQFELYSYDVDTNLPYQITIISENIDYDQDILNMSLKMFVHQATAYRIKTSQIVHKRRKDSGDIESEVNISLMNTAFRVQKKYVFGSHIWLKVSQFTENYFLNSIEDDGFVRIEIQQVLNQMRKLQKDIKLINHRKSLDFVVAQMKLMIIPKEKIQVIYVNNTIIEVVKYNYHGKNMVVD